MIAEKNGWRELEQRLSVVGRPETNAAYSYIHLHVAKKVMIKIMVVRLRWDLRQISTLIYDDYASCFPFPTGCLALHLPRPLASSVSASVTCQEEMR